MSSGRGKYYNAIEFLLLKLLWSQGLQHCEYRQMRTPEEVATDFNGRRAGILKALIDDVDQFYQCCDPERENLCLYGNQDGTWEVALPAEEVPPEMPEPSLGINFARNGMQVRQKPFVSLSLDLLSREQPDHVYSLQRKDWLALVAVHSDTWLLAVAFYNGARLNKAGRYSLITALS